MVQKNLLQSIENRQWAKEYWRNIRRKIDEAVEDEDKMALLEIMALRDMARSFYARSAPPKESPLSTKSKTKSKSFLRRA